MNKAIVLAVLAFASLAASCGGSDDDTGGVGGSGASGGNSGTSGHAGSGGLTDAGGDGAVSDCSSFASKTLDALTTSELERLCDCVAAIYGGYGQKLVCGDGGMTWTFDESRQACVESAVPVSCATAGDVLQCNSELKKTCSTKTPACTGYFQCLGADGG